MSATFDCCCHWQLTGPDLEALHAAAKEAGAFLDRHPDVLMSDFSLDEVLETLSVTIVAADKAGARKTLGAFAARIEKAVGVGALRRELLEVEEAPEVPAEW